MIGGSAGSVRFLLTLAPALLADFEIPLLLVVHRMRNEESLLGQILDARLELEVREAEEKEMIRPGVMLVAPADYHVLLEEDMSITLEDTEFVKYSRPSIDVTFTSAASTFGGGTVGILLSGANDDGTDGLRAIVRSGGRAIVQNPGEAEFEAMPQYAIAALEECEIMGREEMTAFLSGLRSKVEVSGRGFSSTERRRGHQPG